MKTYWKVTRDHIKDRHDPTDPCKVGRAGEDWDEAKYKQEKKQGRAWDFRLYDDDRILYYTGVGYGVVDFDPLDWGTWYAGCTIMEWREKGKDWGVL